MLEGIQVSEGKDGRAGEVMGIFYEPGRRGAFSNSA